jgi:riboflavin transporter FmnP
MSVIFTAIACLLVALAFTLTPMAPGGQVDTRDFSELPRWQFNLFNVFLISLGVASLATAGFAIAEVGGSLVVALVIGILYTAVFALDLGRVFPVVKDALP